MDIKFTKEHKIYKVKNSMFTPETTLYGSSWRGIVKFLENTIGFDVTITNEDVTDTSFFNQISDGWISNDGEILVKNVALSELSLWADNVKKYDKEDETLDN